MKKDKRKNLLILIAILILVIVVVIEIIIYRDINTEKYSISRKDGEKIINNLPYSNNIIYVIDNFMYDGYVWFGGITDSVCDIKIYDDGRVVGNGYYCDEEKGEIKKKIKFQINGMISEEDTLRLRNLVKNNLGNINLKENNLQMLSISNNILEKNTGTFELKKVSLSLPEFKTYNGKEILTEFNLYNGQLVRNGVKISYYYKEIRETLKKYKIIEVK